MVLRSSGLERVEVLPLKDAMSEVVGGLLNKAEDWGRGGVHTSVNGSASGATPSPWALKDLETTCAASVSEPEVSFQDEDVLRDWEERFHITLKSGVLCIGHAGN